MSEHTRHFLAIKQPEKYIVYIYIYKIVRYKDILFRHSKIHINITVIYIERKFHLLYTWKGGREKVTSSKLRNSLSAVEGGKRTRSLGTIRWGEREREKLFFFILHERQCVKHYSASTTAIQSTEHVKSFCWTSDTWRRTEWKAHSGKLDVINVLVDRVDLELF